MKTRKEMKKAAKHVIKKHYFLIVVACFVLAFAGQEFATSVEVISATDSETVNSDTTKTKVPVSGISAMDVMDHAISGDVKTVKEKAEKKEESMVKESKEKDVNPVFGHTRGVLASAVNAIGSGTIFITILAAIQSVVRSADVATGIFVVLSFALLFGGWFFFQNILGAVIRRIMLECRTYEKVPSSRFVFFFRVKRWTRVACVMCKKIVYEFLWMLTIVGGMIKSYSYKMVPYIIAENPNMKSKEAITLSRKMMNGHKWECFKLDVSFVLWNALGLCTFGLLNIFFVNPYILATYTEYYAELRKLAIDNKIDGYEFFNDKYLYERASEGMINHAYEEVCQLAAEPHEEYQEKKGIRRFIANYFGIILFVDKQELAYEKEQVRQLEIFRYQDILDGKCYPGRLFTIPEPEKRQKVKQIRYLRRYSVWSIIMLFFIFAFIGWCWEVSLHLISDGVFVNRGVLHGPWLPIYGTGGVLILIVLNKFRKNPAVELVTAMILCGCVEYYTSYYLEMSHGKKWWDYSGYFLNINGRICVEGILVFGMGGMGIVYFLAPLLDNLIRKIKIQLLVPACVVLLGLFAVDQVYSGKHPNSGKGITDYQSRMETGSLYIADTNKEWHVLC